MTGDTQLLKGVLPMLVLGSLRARGESYGYELVTTLREAGLEDLSTGTLYPVLARLERDGWVASRLVASSSGPARKYYAPTDVGRAELDRAHRAWGELAAVVTGMLGHVPDRPEPAPHTA